MRTIDAFETHTAEYEQWFDENQAAYLSELNAIRGQIPLRGEGVEIGVGTARFAASLGIKFGVEPSAQMAVIAKRRGVQVVQGIGERLPFAQAQFDFALMVTTICFLDNVERAFREVDRVLKNKGAFVIGFIDKNSPIGRSYQRHQRDSTFYSDAKFCSAEEVLHTLKQVGFRDITSVQTIFRPLSETTHTESVEPGFGKGSFVVIRGSK